MIIKNMQRPTLLQQQQLPSPFLKIFLHLLLHVLPTVHSLKIVSTRNSSEKRTKPPFPRTARSSRKHSTKIEAFLHSNAPTIGNILKQSLLTGSTNQKS